MVDGSPVPPGGLLGMDRTVVMQDGTSTFLDSIAYDDSLQGGGGGFPLDEQMGAGHLNAGRALQQFSPGEFPSDSAEVPAIGWDYGNTTGDEDIAKYPIAGQLLADHFISITLAWDREVLFDIDGGSTGVYDAGDTFAESMSSSPDPDSDDLINGLDLFLLPKGSATFSQAVAQSISAEGTLQHIFFQIPQTDEYEIWVHQYDDDPPGTGQNYALAWWASPVVAIFDPGDYNGDQVVNGEDYEVWSEQFGQSAAPGAGADGNRDGAVNAADYVVWRKSFDAAGSGGLAQVPEPSGLMLCALGCLLLASRRSNT